VLHHSSNGLTKISQKKDKKIFKTNNNMVAILSKLSTTMCHAFIFDKTQMSTLVNLDSDSLEGENVEVAITIKVILDSTCS
jgi:hypothetical protein